MIEWVTPLTGLVAGAGGIAIGWRRASSERQHVRSPAEMADSAFSAQWQLLEALTVEVSSLRTEVMSLTSENHKLRNEVNRLRVDLSLARKGLGGLESL